MPAELDRPTWSSVTVREAAGSPAVESRKNRLLAFAVTAGCRNREGFIFLYGRNPWRCRLASLHGFWMTQSDGFSSQLLPKVIHYEPHQPSHVLLDLAFVPAGMALNIVQVGSRTFVLTNPALLILR